VNAPSNLGIILGAPLATQNINVDGSQNNDQSNTCSDDDLGVPGAINCVNDAATIGNLFVLDNTNGAGDVQVDSFEQSNTQANNCQLFDDCINVAGNTLAIVAEDNDGLAATNVDAFVGSSVQTNTQGNDCQGTIQPDPQCTNVDLNTIAIAAVVDGDVNLDDSTQTANSNNNCDDGQVICNNVGLNTLDMVANGENAETDLGTNVQTVDPQSNNCVNPGTFCDNGASNTAVLSATDDAVVDISDNTQTSGQDNTCDSGAVCTNEAINTFAAAATGTSTLTGSNTQSKSQSNTCSAAGCVNVGDNLNCCSS
jgi:hypothetical protein